MGVKGVDSSAASSSMIVIGRFVEVVDLTLRFSGLRKTSNWLITGGVARADRQAGRREEFRGGGAVAGRSR